MLMHMHVAQGVDEWLRFWLSDKTAKKIVMPVKEEKNAKLFNLHYNLMPWINVWKSCKLFLPAAAAFSHMPMEFENLRLN